MAEHHASIAMSKSSIEDNRPVTKQDLQKLEQRLIEQWKSGSLCRTATPATDQEPQPEVATSSTPPPTTIPQINLAQMAPEEWPSVMPVSATLLQSPRAAHGLTSAAAIYELWENGTSSFPSMKHLEQKYATKWRTNRAAEGKQVSRIRNIASKWANKPESEHKAIVQDLDDKLDAQRQTTQVTSAVRFLAEVVAREQPNFGVVSQDRRQRHAHKRARLNKDTE